MAFASADAAWILCYHDGDRVALTLLRSRDPSELPGPLVPRRSRGRVPGRSADPLRPHRERVSARADSAAARERGRHAARDPERLARGLAFLPAGARGPG